MKCSYEVTVQIITETQKKGYDNAKHTDKQQRENNSFVDSQTVYA